MPRTAPSRAYPARSVKILKAIGTSDLEGGGKLNPAQGLVEREVEPEEVPDLTAFSRPRRISLRNLSAESIRDASDAELGDLHRESHEAWGSLSGGLGEWSGAKKAVRRRENFAGLKIAIEYDRGEARTGKSADGRTWERVMRWPYGYIVGSVGLDGEPVDVYLGPDLEAPMAYVVHQAKVLGPGEIGGYDEDKVMLGFGSEHEAREAYICHYPDARFIAAVTPVPVDALRERVIGGKKVSLAKSWDAVVDVMKILFTSPSGKRAVAKKIASVMPPHRTYVEPFAGSAAVFFAKEACPLEVLSDKNKDIAEAFRVAKSLSESDLEKLAGMDWKSSAKTFAAVKSSDPKDSLSWLHKFLYMRRFSILGKGKDHNPSTDGAVAQTVKRMIPHLARLKNARVMSGDYERPMLEFDDEDTLHFLDPPYKGKNAGVGEGEFDEDRFVDLLGKLKGKWIVTYLADGPMIEKMKAMGAKVKFFVQRRARSSWNGGDAVMWQSIATNFPLPDAEWLHDAPAASEAKPAQKSAARAVEFNPNDALVIESGKIHVLRGVVDSDAWRTEKMVAVEADAGPAAEVHAARPDVAVAVGDGPMPDPADVAALVKVATGVVVGSSSGYDAHSVAKYGLAIVLHARPPSFSLEGFAPSGEAWGAAVKAMGAAGYVVEARDGSVIGTAKAMTAEDHASLLDRVSVVSREMAEDMRAGKIQPPADEGPARAVAETVARWEQTRKSVGGDGLADALGLLAGSVDYDCEVEKVIFSSNSSKRTVADKLASILPDHDTYVEPFAGSAAVFFAKPMVDLEILSDRDDGIARAYRAIKGLTQSAISRLERMDWRGSPRTLRKLAAWKPRDELGFLYKFLYQKRFSIFERGVHFRTGAEGSISKAVEKIKKFLPRFKNTRVMSGDYEKPMREFDSPSTLHFLDPPYKGKKAHVGEGEFDEDRFFNVVRAMKGKVAITLDGESELAHKLKAAGYKLKFFWQKRRIANWRGGSPDLWQALVTNFDLPAVDWLKDKPSHSSPTTKAASLAPHEIRAIHNALIAPEMIRRGMPHDSDLPPLFPEQDEDDGLAEQHQDEGVEDEEEQKQKLAASAVALAKAASVPPAAALAWLKKDADAAQSAADAMPNVTLGETGEGLILTVERGLSDDAFAETDGLGWEPISRNIDAATLAALSDADPGRDWAGLVNIAAEGDEAPLRAAALELRARKDAPARARKALAVVEPPECHTVVMLRRSSGEWEGFRVASPGAQHAGSGLLAAASGARKALVDGRDIPQMPIDSSWSDGANRWARQKVRAKFTWKAGRQTGQWRELELRGAGEVDGPWVLQEVDAGGERVTVLRRPDVDVQKRATVQVEIVEVSKREDLHTVTGVVLQPEITDAQRDVVNEQTIRDAAWKFAANYGREGGTKIGFMHNDFSRPFEMVETWIAPQDLTIGGRKILKGSWVMTVRVLDEEVWRGVKSGRIRGFSIGGMARVQRL